MFFAMSIIPFVIFLNQVLSASIRELNNNCSIKPSYDSYCLPTYDDECSKTTFDGTPPECKRLPTGKYETWPNRYKCESDKTCDIMKDGSNCCSEVDGMKWCPTNCPWICQLWNCCSNQTKSDKYLVNIPEKHPDCDLRNGECWYRGHRIERCKNSIPSNPPTHKVAYPASVCCTSLVLIDNLDPNSTTKSYYIKKTYDILNPLYIGTLDHEKYAIWRYGTGWARGMLSKFNDGFYTPTDGKSQDSVMCPSDTNLILLNLGTKDGKPWTDSLSIKCASIIDGVGGQNLLNLTDTKPCKLDRPANFFNRGDGGGGREIRVNEGVNSMDECIKQVCAVTKEYGNHITGVTISDNVAPLVNKKECYAEFDMRAVFRVHNWRTCPLLDLCNIYDRRRVEEKNSEQCTDKLYYFWYIHSSHLYAQNL